MRFLGEGVGPGFDFRDFEFVSKEKLKRNLSNKSNFFVLEAVQTRHRRHGQVLREDS